MVEKTPKIKKEKKVEQIVEAPKRTTKVTTTKKNSSLEVPVYNIEGKQQKTLQLPEEIFGVEVNENLLAQSVRVYMTNQRQGNASTKHRGEVTGSTRKIYRQKGTGNARHGSIKAPIFVGGGVVGGPRTSDYSLKMTKKQKRKALLSALSMKAKDNSVAAIEQSIVTMEPKTKKVVEMLKNIGLEGKKTIVVLSQFENNGLYLSARNIPSVEMIAAHSLNPYKLLAHEKIIFTEDALTVLSSQYLPKNE